MATNGGNLLQRTRCYYFYDTATLPAISANPAQRALPSMASTVCMQILGTSEHCIATHPSDMCVALAALESGRSRHRKNGDRTIPFAEFHRLPGAYAAPRPSNLQADEIITAVDLPAKGSAGTYVCKSSRSEVSMRSRSVSVAAAFEMDGDTIRPSAPCFGRRSAQALARCGSRSDARRQKCHSGKTSKKSRTLSCAMPKASATTLSK